MFTDAVFGGLCPAMPLIGKCLRRWLFRRLGSYAPIKKQAMADLFGTDYLNKPADTSLRRNPHALEAEKTVADHIPAILLTASFAGIWIFVLMSYVMDSISEVRKQRGHTKPGPHYLGNRKRSRSKREMTEMAS